jgi:hypothetical protein
VNKLHTIIGRLQFRSAVGLSSDQERSKQWLSKTGKRPWELVRPRLDNVKSKRSEEMRLEFLLHFFFKKKVLQKFPESVQDLV